jgi:tetratricopeptide (TPR) repeat protein
VGPAPSLRRWAALLALATLALYARVAWHPFIHFDDNRYVTENAQVQAGLTLAGLEWAFTTLHAANWHPLTWLSHMLDVQVFGLNPGAHHLVNAALHAANAAVLFLALARMTGAPGRSLAVAALFAAHPLHVESVAWVAERKDLLSTLFGLLALWEYARERRRTWLVALLFALSLLAKPMWVTFPFLLLLLDFWPLGRGVHIAEKAPLLGLSIGSSVITMVAQTAGNAVTALPILVRLENAIVAYVQYLGKAIFPWPLAIFYPHEGVALPAWKVGASVVLLAAITAVAIAQRKDRPWLLVGWLWFLGTLVPVIGIVQVGAQAMADRYTYLPMVGLFVAAAWTIRWPAAAGAALAACCALTLVQLGYWSSHEALFRHALAVTPDNALAEGVLSEGLLHDGKLDEALRHAERSVELDPRGSKHWNNLAAVQRAVERWDDAEVSLRNALGVDPAYALAWKNLGEVSQHQGRNEEAADAYAQLARLQPGNVAAWNNLGMTSMRLGRFQAAEAAFTSGLRADPANAALQNNLRVCQRALHAAGGSATR